MSESTKLTTGAADSVRPLIEITADSVKQGLEALVAEKGEDFIYTERPVAGMDDDDDTSCRYVWDGKPDCFIGQFLAKEGVPLERLANADLFMGGLGHPAVTLLGQLEREGVVTVTDAAKQMLQAAQNKQDSGKTWGTALACAMDYYN